MWHLKQLFPMTYRSHYTDGAGNRHFCVWKMWMGRCYQVEDYFVKE